MSPLLPAGMRVRPGTALAVPRRGVPSAAPAMAVVAQASSPVPGATARGDSGLRQCCKDDLPNTCLLGMTHGRSRRIHHDDMAFADIFYPGNPGRREELIRTHQQILDCLENNFEYANDLTVIVNKHCESNLPPIKYDKEKTIKDTCDTFVARIKEIQYEVAKFQKHLEEKLGTEPFQKLAGIMESSNNGFEIARKVIPAIEGIGVTIGSIASFFMIRGAIYASQLTALCRCMVLLGGSIAGAIVVGVIALGVDFLVSAILGAIERSKLESALAEYKKHLEDIKPASKAFQKAVIEIKVSIESNCK